MLKDKRGFLDMEVLTSLGFVILFVLAASATIIGYGLSKKWDMVPLPLWQLVVILVGEFFASYFFIARG